MTANIITINWQSLCYSDYNIVIILFWQNNECLHHVDSGFDLLWLNSIKFKFYRCPSSTPWDSLRAMCLKNMSTMPFCSHTYQNTELQNTTRESIIVALVISCCSHFEKEKKITRTLSSHAKYQYFTCLKNTCSWQLEWFCVTTDFQ